MSASNELEALRIAVYLSRSTQGTVAKALGLEKSLFSRYLRGINPPPDGFIATVYAMLTRLEEAEAAADQARERVLTEGE